MTTNKKKNKKFTKKFIIFSIIIFIQLFFIMLYSGGYFLKVYINGNKYFLKTADNIKNIVEKNAKNRKIIIKTENEIKDFELKDIEYNEKIDLETLKKVQKSQSFIGLQFSLFFKNSYKINSDISYNKDSFDTFIEKIYKNIEGDKESKDAFISKNEEKNIFVINEEIYGNQIDKSKLREKIYFLMDKKENKIIELKELDVYIKPNVKKDDNNLIKNLEKYNELKDLVITYNFGDTKEILTIDNFKDWFEFDNENLNISDEKVLKYISELAKKYNTYGTKRKFTTIDGKEITINGGTYGYQADIYKSKDNLIKYIKEGKNVNIDLDYKIKGFERKNGSDIGDTYIEVSLNKQHLWYKKDGKIIFETDFVSGNPTTNNSTPVGIFSVWSKEKNRYLTGQDYNVKVNYWMPFDWSGVGFHDASWRSGFGKEIYKSNGSHGCVNLPFNSAKTIFNLVEYQTPVIVY